MGINLFVLAISAGFSGILARQIISFPATRIFFVSTKFIGTSEIALRIPSILAVLARLICCISPRVSSSSAISHLLRPSFFAFIASLFSRPLMPGPTRFAILAVNAAILVMLRLRRTDSNWLAALFGFLAHVSSGFISPLPPFFRLILCFFITKFRDRKTMCGIRNCGCRVCAGASTGDSEISLRLARLRNPGLRQPPL